VLPWPAAPLLLEQYSKKVTRSSHFNEKIRHPDICSTVSTEDDQRSRGHQSLAVRSFWFLLLAEHISTYNYLNIHSVQLIKLSKALVVTLTHSAHFAGLPSSVSNLTTQSCHQSQTFFYLWLLKKASCANLCAILWRFFIVEAAFNQAPPFALTSFEFWAS
jgi:hypothetical protein